MVKRKEVEQQSQELQSQVTALQEQIITLTAQVQGLQTQLEAREKQTRELNEQVEKYRARESAIVATMTDARQSGAKRIAEAEQKAYDIIASAQEQSRRMLAEADARAKEHETKSAAIEYDASRRAQKLVQGVQEDINNKLKQVEEDVAEFQLRITKLNQSLNEAVTQARAQAESFARALQGVLENTDALTTQSRGLSALIDEKREVSPDEYANASQFMQDMYKMEGRDLPPIATAPDVPAPTASENEPAAAEPFFFKQPAKQQDTQSEAPPTPQDSFAFKMPEEAPKPWDAPKPWETPFSFTMPEMPPKVPEQPKQETPLSSAGISSTQNEERVWTVDEIIAQQKKDEKSTGAIDLDSLLDEIMN